MSASIDIEISKPNRLNLVTGTIVLLVAYIAVLVVVAWLRR